MNAIRYEWRRINSVRATWILTGTVLALAVIAGLGTLLAGVTIHGVAINGQPVRTLAGTVNGYLPAGLLLLTILGAQAFGQE